VVSEALLVDHSWPVVSMIELLVSNEVHGVSKMWYHPKRDSRLFLSAFRWANWGKTREISGRTVSIPYITWTNHATDTIQRLCHYIRLLFKISYIITLCACNLQNFWDVWKRTPRKMYRTARKVERIWIKLDLGRWVGWDCSTQRKDKEHKQISG